MCGAAKGHFRDLLQSCQCPAGAPLSVAARAAAAAGAWQDEPRGVRLWHLSGRAAQAGAAVGGE